MEHNAMKKRGVAFGENNIWRRGKRQKAEKEEEENVSHYGTETSDTANATFVHVAVM